MAYTPTLWAKGDKVTSAKLNKIEQGIVDKVDKEAGKTLSTNDFTDAYKTKLEGIEANADKTTIDATLTNSGAAADAKATGDAIKGIETDLDGKVATIESNLDEKVENLKSLVGTPLKATTASAMTDTSKIYVYTGNESGYTNGDWYYHDGSAWVDGGTYNSVAVEVDKTLTVDGMPADAKVIGDEIGALKSGFTQMQTATAEDVGKALKAKTVTDGKVTEWEFGEAGGSVELDAILTDPTKAAQAKAVGDILNGSDGGSVDVTAQAKWVAGHGISGNTGNINNETTSYAEYNVDGVTHVSGYTRGGNDTSRGMAFYTASGGYISGDNHYPSDTGYDWNYSFDVPENAALFRITCANPYKDRFTCFFQSGATIGLKQKVSTLETKVAEIEEVIGDIGTDVEINELESSLPYKWVDGYALSPSLAVNNPNRGKLITASTQSVAIANVTNCAGGVISGHTRLGDDYAIGFFDQNGVMISGTIRPSGTDYEWDFILQVPEFAKSVIITCKTTSKSLFSLKGKGVASAVNNLRGKSALEYDCPSDVYGLDSVRSDFHFDSQTRLQDVYTWFNILTSTFPRNVTRVQIGTSTTPEGSYAEIDSNTYPIYAYVIQGDNYVAGNEFIVASGIHGDETVGDGIQSVVSVAYFIRDMLCHPDKSEFMRFMKWNCKILVIPVMNPWGYQNGKRCNGRGVDVNRNFDINFDPTYESYGYTSGTSAFSENESASVANYISTNFANAKYCTELHTRGGNTLPNDDRWFTTTTSTATIMQSAVTEVGYYMRKIYGGAVSNGQQSADSLPSTFRAYVDHVLNIPANLIECAKSVNSDITTFNSDLVQRQYVQYLGSMTQKLVETFVM